MVKGVETNENSRFVDHTMATPWEEFVNDLELSFRSLYMTLNKNFSSIRRKEAEETFKNKQKLEELTLVPNTLDLELTDEEKEKLRKEREEKEEEERRKKIKIPYPTNQDIDGLHYEVNYLDITFIIEVVDSSSASFFPQYILPPNSISSSDSLYGTFSNLQDHFSPSILTSSTSSLPSSPLPSSSPSLSIPTSSSSSIYNLSPSLWPGPLLHVLSYGASSSPSSLYNYVIRIHPRDSQALSDPGDHSAVFSAFSTAVRSAGLSPLPIFLTLDSISYLDSCSVTTSAIQDENFFLNFLNNQRLDRQFNSILISPYLKLYEGNYLHSFPRLLYSSSLSPSSSLTSSFLIFPSTHLSLSYSNFSSFINGQNITNILNTPDISLAYHQLSLLPLEALNASSFTFPSFHRYKRIESSTYKRINPKHQLFYYDGIRKLFLKKIHLLNKYTQLIENFNREDDKNGEIKEILHGMNSSQHLLSDTHWPFHSFIIHFYEYSLTKWLFLCEKSMTDSLRQHFLSEYERLTKNMSEESKIADKLNRNIDFLGGNYAMRENESISFSGYDLYEGIRKKEEEIYIEIFEKKGNNEIINDLIINLVKDLKSISNFPSLALSSITVQLPFSEVNPWAVLDSEAYSSLLPARLHHSSWRINGQFQAVTSLPYSTSSINSPHPLQNFLFHSNWKSSILQKLLSFFIFTNFTSTICSSSLSLTFLAQSENLAFSSTDQIIREVLPLLSPPSLDYLRTFLKNTNENSNQEEFESTSSSSFSSFSSFSSSISYDLKSLALNLAFNSTPSSSSSELFNFSTLFNSFFNTLSDERDQENKENFDSGSSSKPSFPPYSSFSLCNQTLWDDLSTSSLTIPSLTESLPKQLLHLIKFCLKVENISLFRELPYTFTNKENKKIFRIIPLPRRLPLTSLSEKMQIRLLNKSKSGQSESLKEGAKRLHGLLPHIISDLRVFIKVSLEKSTFPLLLDLYNVLDEKEENKMVEKPKISNEYKEEEEEEFELLPYYFDKFSSSLYKSFIDFYHISITKEDEKRYTNIFFVLSQEERVKEEELILLWGELIQEGFQEIILNNEKLFYTNDEIHKFIQEESSSPAIPSISTLNIRPLFNPSKEYEKAITIFEGLPLSLVVSDMIYETVDYISNYIEDLEQSLVKISSEPSSLKKDEKDFETERDLIDKEQNNVEEKKTSFMFNQIIKQSILSLSSLSSTYFQELHQLINQFKSFYKAYISSILKYRVTSEKSLYIPPSLFNPMEFYEDADELDEDSSFTKENSSLWYPEAKFINILDKIINSLQNFDIFFSKSIQFLPFLGHIYGRTHLLAAACPFLSINTNTDLSLQELFTKMLTNLTSSTSNTTPPSCSTLQSSSFSYFNNTTNLFAPEYAVVTRHALRELKSLPLLSFSSINKDKLSQSSRDNFSLDGAELGIPHGKIFILQTPHIYKSLSINDEMKRKKEIKKHEKLLKKKEQEREKENTLIVKLDFDSPPATPMKEISGDSDSEEEADEGATSNFLHPIHSSLEVYPESLGLFKMTAITNGKVIRTIYESIEDS